MNNVTLNNNLIENELFKGISNNELNKINPNFFIEQHYNPDDIIIKENDDSNEIFLIIDGSVIIKKHINDKKEVKMITRQKGDIIGELGVIENNRRTSSVICKTEVVVIKIERDHFFAILNQIPQINLNINHIIASRFREAIYQNAFEISKYKGLLELNQTIVKQKEELKRLNSKQEESNLMLNAILKSIPDTIVTVDQNLKIINANHPLTEICFAPVKHDRVNIRNILNKRTGPCYEMLHKTLETKQAVKEFRTKCSCVYETNTTIVLSTTPLIDIHNKFSGAVLVIRDISKLASLEKKINEQKGFKNIVTNNNKMHKIISLIQQTSDLDINFLITGESGTGKELIADALHYTSSRSSEPFIKVNCAALSENLLESELFGHVRGAFTGAVSNRIGRIQAAEKGTLFLDEIGEVSLMFQAKLLRFLEQKEYERIGESKTLKANVRIVAATNKSLEESVMNGTFRKDLFYRLKGIIYNIPPLRERIEDIPLLVNFFIKNFRKHNNKNIIGASDEVINILMSHHWPGNIRELKQAIEYCCAICNEEIIHIDHLPSELLSSPKQNFSSTQQDTLKNESEKTLLLQALNRTDWNKAKTARLLGISRGTLYNRLLKLNIES